MRTAGLPYAEEVDPKTLTCTGIRGTPKRGFPIIADRPQVSTVNFIEMAGGDRTPPTSKIVDLSSEITIFIGGWGDPARVVYD